MVRLPVAGTDTLYSVQPSKIIALGLNYRDHIAESESVRVSGFTSDVPTEPILFAKTPNVLVGNDEAIVIPKILADYAFPEPRTDHEAELAVIVSRQCRDLPSEQAFSAVLGYTCMNDVSQRNIQNGDRSGWFRGKSFDTFGPIGPRIVPHEQIGDPQNLEIICRKNGKEVQHSNTRYMIFPIPEIIAFVSRNFTLEPGDIILTGTPSGVGPLIPGDVVEVEIEKIGVLRNPVTAAGT
ncbi:fumarylacetoacetate hydrolase family protein [Salinispira pacifica]